MVVESTGFLPSAVSSVNLSDCFHLGIESKTLLCFFQFFSRERSRILAQSLPKRGPEPSFHADISPEVLSSVDPPP